MTLKEKGSDSWSIYLPGEAYQGCIELNWNPVITSKYCLDLGYSNHQTLYYGSFEQLSKKAAEILCGRT